MMFFNSLVFVSLFLSFYYVANAFIPKFAKSSSNRKNSPILFGKKRFTKATVKKIEENISAGRSSVEREDEVSGAKISRSADSRVVVVSSQSSMQYQQSPISSSNNDMPSSRTNVGEYSTLTDESIKELLQKDMRNFDTGSAKQSENTVIKTAKDIFGVIFIADFFIVIAFLVWFLAGAALQSSNPVVLERFQDIFQPVVVPSLTVLMVGSFVTGYKQNEKS